MIPMGIIMKLESEKKFVRAIQYLLFVIVLIGTRTWAEDWTVNGTTYKDAKVVNHDAKVVTISSSRGIATLSLSLLSKELQERVLGDNTTSTDWIVNGTVYHHVTVSQIEPDRVHIAYDGGAGTVQLSDLPPDLQKRFNYDPTKAQIAAQNRERQQGAIDAARARQQQAQADNDALVQNAQALATSKGITIMGKVLSIIPQPGGWNAYLVDLCQGNQVLGPVPTGQTALLAGDGLRDDYVTGDMIYSAVLISDDTPNRGRWYYAGTYSYVSVAGAAITCRVYSPSRAWAVKNLIAQPRK